jgi:hypothetical protein
MNPLTAAIADADRHRIASAVCAAISGRLPFRGHFMADGLRVPGDDLIAQPARQIVRIGDRGFTEAKATPDLGPPAARRASSPV